MTTQFQILNKILQTGDYSLVLLNNLTEDYFPGYSSEFKYIKSHFEKFGSVPDRLTFVDTFPDFDIKDVNEPDSYLVEQINKDYNAQYIAKQFNVLKKYIEEDKIDEAVAYLVNAANNIHQNASQTCTDLFQDTSRYDKYVERINSRDKFFIKTGFPELDDIIGGIDVKEENMVIAARTGKGKCLAKGTKVMMADGTLKAVEEVKIGDKVQSYGRINTVLDLHNGVSNGYRIIPNNGEPFIVSANHILTLYKYDTVCKNHRMVHTGTGHLEDIMIEDYLALSNHKKHQLKLFRPGIEYDTKDLLIDPYILGVWLGDGTSAYGHVCTADREVIESLEAYALANGMNCHELKSQRKGNGQAKLYSLTGETGPAFQTLLRKLNVLENKHIPIQYLTGDKDQRLRLLAGILDTDGHYACRIYRSKSTSQFDFTNKNKVLFDQVAQLARGLGFKVSIGKPKQITTKAGLTSYYRMNISGALHEIPTKILRKQAKVSKAPSTNTGFKVEPVERVEYYGFMCDGDSRYLLADNTLTHNTWTLLKIAVEAARQGYTVGLYSGEMSADKVGYRVDTLLGHIDNKAITRGSADYNPSVGLAYKQYIEHLPTALKGTIKVLTPNDINGPATVGALRTFVEKENIDILLIDQYSLLEDQHHAKVMHEKVANISKDIKNLQVMKQIPIVSVSQMNRTKNDDGEQDTTQIGLSDRIGQDATCIIMLDREVTYSDPEKCVISADKLVLNLVKSRDGGEGRLVYNADFNTGRFTFLNPSLTEAQSEEMRSYYDEEEGTYDPAGTPPW